MKAMRFGVHVLHKPLAFAAARERFARTGQRRKGDFEELIHAFDRLHEVVELPLENLDGVLQNGRKVNLGKEETRSCMKTMDKNLFPMSSGESE